MWVNRCDSSPKLLDTECKDHNDQLKPAHETSFLRLSSKAERGCTSAATLRQRLHLQCRRTGFQTMVGLQPWSHGLLVHLLDRTKFRVPMCAGHNARTCAGYLQGFGLGRISCQTNVCCRSSATGKCEQRSTGAQSRVWRSLRLPRDSTAVTAIKVHSRFALTQRDSKLLRSHSASAWPQCGSGQLAPWKVRDSRVIQGRS